MPINCGAQIELISEEEFYKYDYKVMGLAFSIHKEFGRLWNEEILKNELVFRCRREGFDVSTELPVKASFQTFSKTFYVDLLLNNAIVYELKAVKSLTNEHQQQTLNYLFLLGVHHGKLINMRPPSVESRFVSTNITREKRYDFKIDDQDWQNLDKDSEWLKQMMLNLINEWGTFLDITLFYDAIVHFRKGRDHVIKKIKVTNNKHFLGIQKLHLLNVNTAFQLSSNIKQAKYYEQHLRQFLRYTSLKALQWINFNHEKILFKTIVL